jgi:hypothetical protein
VNILRAFKAYRDLEAANDALVASLEAAKQSAGEGLTIAEIDALKALIEGIAWTPSIQGFAPRQHQVNAVKLLPSGRVLITVSPEVKALVVPVIQAGYELYGYNLHEQTLTVGRRAASDEARTPAA